MFYQTLIATGVFNLYDKDNTGSLDVKEFMEMCKAFEVDMTFNEIDQAISALDKDDSGKIEFNEFMNWWAEEPEI